MIGVRVLRNERNDLREVGNGPVVYAILEEGEAAMTQRIRVQEFSRMASPQATTTAS